MPAHRPYRAQVRGLEPPLIPREGAAPLNLPSGSVVTTLVRPLMQRLHRRAVNRASADSLPALTSHRTKVLMKLLLRELAGAP